MKVGIIGATGKLGSLLVERSLKEGYETTAIVRHPEKLTNTNDLVVEKKDLFDLITQDIEKFDVVINAYNAPSDDLKQFSTSMQKLMDIFQGTKTRLIIAGGAGVSYLPDHSRVIDSPDLPAFIKPLAENEVAAYELLKNDTSFNWLYMTPPLDMQFDAPHTGHHYFSGENLGVDENGKSYISYADYADAFMDEINSGNKHQPMGVYDK
ncbi:NAD(P)H-binding protein [Weissella ceti]|uniref:NAD(P)H-binding protein n=1 Tax=Weissella ceti TaxID=759620 RepID=A0ABT3E3X8_9LACO|nr:NAD(P)H-binding protein [Weissella ceti]MCW0953119.1 NAD(P)H-binding protein [Weissella ceti]QVK12638.1 NAD(P)H-binding protein [Weissella ceti]